MENVTYNLKGFEGICFLTVYITSVNVRARSRFTQLVWTAGALYRYFCGLFYPVKCLVLQYTYH